MTSSFLIFKPYREYIVTCKTVTYRVGGFLQYSIYIYINFFLLQIADPRDFLRKLNVYTHYVRTYVNKNNPNVFVYRDIIWSG